MLHPFLARIACFAALLTLSLFAGSFARRNEKQTRRITASYHFVDAVRSFRLGLLSVVMRPCSNIAKNFHLQFNYFRIWNTTSPHFPRKEKFIAFSLPFSKNIGRCLLDRTLKIRYSEGQTFGTLKMRFFLLGFLEKNVCVSQLCRTKLAKIKWIENRHATIRD